MSMLVSNRLNNRGTSVGKLKNILRNTTSLIVVANKDGTYSVRQDGKIIANNLTNAEAWAMIDRSERRVSWDH
jgi:hypothetical protein